MTTPAYSWEIIAQSLAATMGQPDLPLGVTAALRDAGDADRAALLRVLEAAGAAEATTQVERTIVYRLGNVSLYFEPDGKAALDMGGAGTQDLTTGELWALQDLRALLCEPAVQLAIGKAIDMREEQRVAKSLKGGRR